MDFRIITLNPKLIGSSLYWWTKQMKPKAIANDLYRLDPTRSVDEGISVSFQLQSRSNTNQHKKPTFKPVS